MAGDIAERAIVVAVPPHVRVARTIRRARRLPLIPIFILGIFIVVGLSNGKRHNTSPVPPPGLYPRTR